MSDRVVFDATAKGGASREPSVPVWFGSRFAQSPQFDAIYKEGMALVERTANYLDGAGRKEAKALQPPLTLTYATESMRLTTRLLEVASWLMVHRALKEGEIDQSQAEARRKRVKLTPIGRAAHTKGFDALPAGLRELVDASFVLNDRVIKIDQSMMAVTDAVAPNDNAVVAQVARLEAAFGAAGGPVAA